NTYVDVTDNQSVELGTSIATTPSVRRVGFPSGGGYRMLNGVDLTYRYQPLGSAVYQGLTWGSEFYANSERMPFETDEGSFSKRQRTYGGGRLKKKKKKKKICTGV